MARIIVLNSSPLGLASGPPGKREVGLCLAWIRSLQWSGVLIVAPEIADFEVRRGLVLAGARAGIQRLDLLIGNLI